MNCERIREKLTDVLAAGESELSAGLAQHVKSCEGCHSFYEAQSKLLHSIDAGLGAMVNQDMPRSLFPGFRARLAQQPATGRAWIPVWSLAAAVAVVAILAFSYKAPHRRSAPQPSPSTKVSVVRPTSNGAVLPAPPLTTTVIPSTGQVHRHAIPSVTAPVAAELSTEVIVLAEEQEAFVRFVAEIPMERDKALALTHPAQAKADLPVEITLLQIPNVQVKPLETTPSE